MSASSRLPIAVRAYSRAPPQEGEGTDWSGPDEPKWPPAVLVLDTETTTDERQALLFGTARYCRLKGGAYRCVSEELFYADELPDERPKEFERLQEYAEKRDADVIAGGDTELRLRSRTNFVRAVLYTSAFEGEAAVVGFNLPFDLTRVATHFGEARQDMYGGFSLGMFGDRNSEAGEYSDRPKDPRIVFKTIDSKRAFTRFSSPGRTDASLVDPNSERPPSGRFLDLRTFAFSLTSRGHSLRSACQSFGTRELPGATDEHGEITTPYIDYNRRDVRVTQQLLNRLKREFDHHPIDRKPDRTYSPASLAKSYLDGMGVQEPRQKFGVEPEIYGRVMETYFGGRAEARIRKEPVPVVYLDFLSMYPTVNSLMGLWKYLSAERVDVEDATEDTRDLLGGLTKDYVFDPEFWRRITFFARVRPDADILPVRAEYDEDSRVPNIGVNRFSTDEGFWYAGPDVVASTILTDEPPEVLEAVRLVPRGKQPGLQEIELRSEFPVDPAEEDFFQRVIEARKSPDGPDRPPEQAQRLDRFLKILANAGSYGIYAEMVRERVPESRPEEVEVYGRGQAFTRETNTPEAPGPYCFPPVASLTSSGARLMLALLERCVSDRGGNYAFCDTDSMAVVASDGSGEPGSTRSEPGSRPVGSNQSPSSYPNRVGTGLRTESQPVNRRSQPDRTTGARGGNDSPSGRWTPGEPGSPISVAESHPPLSERGGRGGRSTSKEGGKVPLSPRATHLQGGTRGYGGGQEGGRGGRPNRPSRGWRYPLEGVAGGMQARREAPSQAPEGGQPRQTRVLSWAEVNDIVERFERLNPYGDEISGSVLEVEDENFRGGDRVPLQAYVISAKRYVLFRGEPGGENFEIVKYSEHGLGHLLDPTGSRSKDWIEYFWERMLREEFGERVEDPDWFDRIAPSRLTVSAPHYSQMFERYNEGKPYREQVTPMNFMLSAHRGAPLNLNRPQC